MFDAMGVGPSHLRPNVSVDNFPITIGTNPARTVVYTFARA